MAKSIGWAIVLRSNWMSETGWSTEPSFSGRAPYSICVLGSQVRTETLDGHQWSWRRTIELKTMIFTDADLSFSPCLVGFASGVKVLFAIAAKGCLVWIWRLTRWGRYMRAVIVHNKIWYWLCIIMFGAWWVCVIFISRAIHNKIRKKNSSLFSLFIQWIFSNKILVGLQTYLKPS